jgi:hypothetical protein
MKFTATDKQAKQIVANAINASRPAGLGFLQYAPAKEFTADDVTIQSFQNGHRTISADYVGGRMVKLAMRSEQPGEWEITWPGETPRGDYQSWCRKYPTTAALVRSVIP